jgi:hypothetical protein
MHRGVVVGGLVLLLFSGCAETAPPLGSAGNGATVTPLAGTGGVGAGGTGIIPPSGTSGRGGTGGATTGTGGVGPTPTVGGMSGGSGMGGTAGTMATAGVGASGMGASGAGASGSGGTTPTEPGVVEPTVPMVTETCPEFRSGTINFMGLGGIVLQAGSKASAATAPMIFYWHGTGSTSGEYVGSFGAGHQGAMSEGGVLISFQGTTGGDLLSGTATFGRGDFELTDQLFACAVQNHNVDPRRVFSTGCSAGGLFAGAMAAARSSYIAAVAPNSGGWTTPVQFQTDWTPALMTVHGRPGGDVVIVDFSNTSRTADMAFKNRGGFVINCDHGGGHCGGRGLAPDMWEFFKAHPYGTKPSPWAGGLPSGFNSDCMIF